MSDFSPRDIYIIFYRARRLFALSFGLLFVASILFAYQWSRYRAEATVQIQQPEVPASLTNVGNTGSTDSALGLADRRISQIQQDVTSNASLQKIIKKLDLYNSSGSKLTPDTLAHIMRSNIRLNFIGSTIANPAAAQKESIEQLSAIAFSLRFTYHDPVMAKHALDAILEQLIAAEAQARAERNREILSFLDQEIALLETSIHEQEARIAQFKAEFGESGPAAMMFNQQASLNSSVLLQTLTTQIASAEANIQSLSAQLAATSPYVLDADEKAAPPASKQSLETQLALLQGRYGDAHPDVVKLKQQLQALPSGHTSSRIARDANNPAYIQLSSQYTAANASLAALKQQRQALEKQHASYQQMIAKNPEAEQKMAQLTLDLDHDKERHRTLKDKRLGAEMKAKLDAESEQSRLRVIHPSTVPAQTTPARTLIVLAGFFLALLGASTLVIIREFLCHSVRSASHLTSIIGTPPLVSIPIIYSR